MLNKKSSFYKYYFYIFESTNIISSLYIPIITKQIVDSIASYDYSDFYRYAIILTATILFFIVTLSLSNLFQNKYEEHQIANWKELLIKYINFSKIEDISEKSVGYFLSRNNDDFENMKDFIIYIPFKRITHGISFFIIFSILFYTNVILTIAMLITFPIFIFLQKKMTQKLSIQNNEILESKEVINTEIEEIVNMNLMIRAIGGCKKVVEKVTRSIHNQLRLTIERINTEIIYDYLFATGTLNLISIIVYVLGGFFVLSSEITIGSLMLFSLYYSKLWPPLEFFLAYPKNKAKYIVSYERVKTIINFEPVQDSDNEFSMDFPITVKNLVLKYDEKTIINDSSLSISKGDHIALIGPNGSGKSSFAKTLAGLNNKFEGLIILNNTKINDFSYSLINSFIQYIPAEPELFSGSIRDNITMFGLFPAVELLKPLTDNGITLDLRVGESTKTLSAGEKKIVQLQRSLQAEASVYIIDEPLNYIDSNNKKMVVDYLINKLNTKTFIIISHDPEALTITNKRWIIENNTIKEVIE